MIHHAQPRFTKDLDLWVEPSPANASRVARALREFGVPLIEITEADFAEAGTQFMIGRPPTAIDFLTSIPGLRFEDCWPNRATTEDLGFPAHYVSRDDLIKAKETAGRLQDQADIVELRRAQELE